MSYCQLLSRPFAELLCRCPPGVVIFYIHMQDLFNPPEFEDLLPFYCVIRSPPEYAHQYPRQYLQETSGLNPYFYGESYVQEGTQSEQYRRPRLSSTSYTTSPQSAQRSGT